MVATIDITAVLGPGRTQLILLSICSRKISSIKHGSLHLFICSKHREDVALASFFSLGPTFLIISVLDFWERSLRQRIISRMAIVAM